MDFYSLDNDWKGKGRKYNNVSDTSLHEFSDLNKRDELKENRESNKECEDVKPEFTECSTKDGSYNVPIKGENYMSSEYSISSKYRKQTKYKKIVLTVLFFSCLITLAVAGAVIFGNSTHSRQHFNENFPDNEITSGKNFSSMEIPTPTTDSSIKYTTENIDITVTSRKSKTSERISSSMPVLLTTLSKLIPGSSITQETSLPNFSPSVWTNANTSTNDRNPSSDKSMTTSKSESSSKRISTDGSVLPTTPSISRSSVTTSKSDSTSSRIPIDGSLPMPTSSIIQPSVTTSISESISKRILNGSVTIATSSITQPPVTTSKSESPSKRISSTLSVPSPTSSITQSSGTTSKSESPSKRMHTSSVSSPTLTITHTLLTKSQFNNSSERISTTSSPTLSSITEQKQLTTNNTFIGKETTVPFNTHFVATTSSTKTSSAISTTKEELPNSSRKTIYPITQSRSIPTATTSMSKIHSSAPTTIKIPLPDAQKIPQLATTKTFSQVPTTVTTFVKPLTKEQKTTSLSFTHESTTMTKKSV